MTDEGVEPTGETEPPSVDVTTARRRWPIFLVIVVLVLAALAGGYEIGHRTSPTPAAALHRPAASPTTHHHLKVVPYLTTTTTTTTTTAPSSSFGFGTGSGPSPISSDDAPDAAGAIVTTLSDVPSSFIAQGRTVYKPTSSAGVTPGLGTGLGTCTPISGQPWLGEADAGFGSVGANQGISATVWVMHTQAMAQQSLDAVLAPSFGPACLQPNEDSYVKRNAYSVGEPNACGGLVFTSSTIERLRAPDEGWFYTSSLHCANTTDSYVSTSDEDIILAMHGPIVMQVAYTSATGALSEAEHLLAIMEFRAAAFSTASVSP
jgi:hypothetical protein